ncbi:MAG: tRNA uridine-5-carboxymethylaminomethyl(34) synthesis GTPase MnmE [candidate division Zixibacteria bacterium]|nr:tRNA uridine-5-carboxymethylaminomethyl(34) synthesis GTPase MnmE [candidate division Zixibacteria bacterium]
MDIFRISKKNIIDEVTAVFMPEGNSFTGLDQVEIFCHGGQTVVNNILNELLDSDCRAAEPGEFTKLAFLSGRINLSEAEAVAEIIAANTKHSYEVAKEHLLGGYSSIIESIKNKLISIIAEIEASIDFPEEEIDIKNKQNIIDSTDQIKSKISELISSYNGGKIIKEGYKIALAGKPNAGKSSLFNLLLKQERALVTETPGTTRDYLSEWIDLDGYAVNIIDTAGIRKGGGKIEKAGQESAKNIIKKADMVIWIADISQNNWSQQALQDVNVIRHNNIIFVGNKIDLIGNKVNRAELDDKKLIKLSCKTGRGLKNLKNYIINSISDNMPDFTSGVIVTSLRHQQKLKSAVEGLDKALELIQITESPELVAVELRATALSIDEITGKIYTEEILGKIFSNFCVGK